MENVELVSLAPRNEKETVLATVYFKSDATSKHQHHQCEVSIYIDAQESYSGLQAAALVAAKAFLKECISENEYKGPYVKPISSISR